jgi:putative nucleotidyltransferase with HDIG domain
MSGIQLLQIIKEKYPETARVVLTAQADPEVLALSRELAHHTLVKSASMEVVFDTLVSALEIKGNSDHAAMLAFIDGTDSVPASARVYQELTDLLRSPTATIDDAATVIERDVAMTAKVMQLVNSAAFGLARRVESSTEAVMYMGLENLRSLALAMKVFTDAESNSMPYGFLSGLWDHSFTTGVYARNIAKRMNVGKSISDMCFAAGMLHDLGKILLVSYNREWYKKVIMRVGDTGDALNKIEMLLIGMSHAEAGAELLARWGIGEQLCDAVRYHHSPRMAPKHTALSLVTVVHLADAFATEKMPSGGVIKAPIDIEYLCELGLHEKVAELKRSCSAD